MLKAGIMGFGGVGRAMAKLLTERRFAEVVGVCDIAPAALKHATDKLGLKATKNPKELCSWDVDFVCVTSTNDAHYEHVLAAAEAGKHILCEKIPALTLAQLDEMIAATEAKNLVTIVNYGRRWQHAYLRMKEEVDSGNLGEVLSMTCYSSRGWGLAMLGNPHPAVAHPDHSGNWLLHHACHIIDYTVWLLGRPKNAFCRSQTTVLAGDSPEILWGMFEYENGPVAVIGDAVSCIYQKWVNIIGTKGTVELIRTPEDNLLHARWETGKEFPYFEDILGYGTDWQHGYPLKELVTRIADGTKSEHDLRATRDAQVAILALEEARKTGRVVSLNEIDPA